MSKPRKRGSAPGIVPLLRVISFLRGPGRPLALAGVLAAVFLGTWCLIWREVRGHVLSGDQYVVGPEQVEITPLPPWIHSDVREEAYRNASLDRPLSLMDDDLTERIAHALSLHPWIGEVRRVTKHHPALVRVEMVYRRPVCMVEVPGGLLPVDARGVLLPVADFSPVEASRYPRLVGVGTAPMGAVGECWGDARVAGGAEIAEVLSPVWAQLKLTQIVPSATLAPGTSEGYAYTLLTREGTRILWGLAPGAANSAEVSAAEKLAWLQKYLSEHGTLGGRGVPREIDLRSLRVR